MTALAPPTTVRRYPNGLAVMVTLTESALYCVRLRHIGPPLERWVPDSETLRLEHDESLAILDLYAQTAAGHLDIFPPLPEIGGYDERDAAAALECSTLAAACITLEEMTTPMPTPKKPALPFVTVNGHRLGAVQTKLVRVLRALGGSAPIAEISPRMGGRSPQAIRNLAYRCNSFQGTRVFRVVDTDTLTLEDFPA